MTLDAEAARQLHNRLHNFLGESEVTGQTRVIVYANLSLVLASVTLAFAAAQVAG